METMMNKKEEGQQQLAVKIQEMQSAMQKAAVEAAKAAGAEFVGFDEFIEKVTSGWTGFDVAVATPEAMGEVRKLGRVLGPRRCGSFCDHSEEQ